MVLINLQLPESVEEEARAAGLLTSEKIAELIQAELKRQRQAAADQMLEKIDAVAAEFRAEFSSLSDEEGLEMLAHWTDEARAAHAGNETDSE